MVQTFVIFSNRYCTVRYSYEPGTYSSKTKQKIFSQFSDLFRRRGPGLEDGEVALSPHDGREVQSSNGYNITHKQKRMQQHTQKRQ
jgi:hypothetical protein